MTEEVLKDTSSRHLVFALSLGGVLWAWSSFQSGSWVAVVEADHCLPMVASLAMKSSLRM